MTLPVSVAFTGTNGTAIRTLADWDGARTDGASGGACVIQSNAAQAGASGQIAADWWTTDTPNANQVARATVTAIAAGAYIGVGVRLSGTDNDGDTLDGYLFYSDAADGSYIDKVINGAWVASIAGPGAVFEVGDAIELSINGTALTAKVNGATLFSVTDSAIATGSFGIAAYASGASAIDNFEGDNLASAQTISPSGIASAEAFGSATVSVASSPQTITPTGIVSSEVFGTAIVTAPAPGQNITPTGIATAEVFGTATVLPGAVSILPAGIASGFTTGLTELLMAACIGGVLTVDGDNGRYFANDASIVFLAGMHTWQVSGADSSPDDPPATLDFDEFLTALTSRGLTFTKMWAMETPQHWPNLTQYFAPLPWARTGPGNANDGKPKFDLDTWDEDYFARMRAWTVRLGNAGVYVCVQMFQGWHYTDKGYANDPYEFHPFNGPNNINSVDGDTNNDNSGLESLDTASSVYSRQQAYVRKVIDTVNDLDNVIFEVANEVDYTTTTLAWERAIAAYIKSYESGLAKQYPVGITKFWPGGNNAALFASDVDWTSTDEEYPTPEPDATDGSMVVIGDSDHWQGLTGEHEWTWQAALRGMNVAFMDQWTGWTYGTDTRTDADAQKIRNQLGYILDYMARVDLRYTTPQSSLASTGYCLARLTGTAKLIAYQPTSGAFTVDLSSVSGTFSLEWLRTSNGATQAGSNVSGGAVRTLTPPWAGEDVVAFLELTELTIVPSGIASASAFGTATIVPGAITISCTGIASAEAFGSTVVQPGAVTVAPAGIASAEAHGTAAVQPGAVTVAPTGIATAEAFGTAVLAAGTVTIVADGIATAEAFGTALVQAGASYIAPTGIASAEAHGSATLQPGAVSILPAGIASGETHGETLLATGAVLQPTGIASSEAHGSAIVQPGAVNIVASGIATAETFGTVALLVDLLVAAAGIATGEAFGDALLSVGGAFVQPAGIDSGEAFGDLVVMPGAVSILPAGIAGGEAFGTLRLVVAGADQYIDVPSVQDGEQFGIATLLMALIAERTLSIRAEARRYVVAAENRTYSVQR